MGATSGRVTDLLVSSFIERENVISTDGNRRRDTGARAPGSDREPPCLSPQRSYDDKQAGAVLTTCCRCGRTYYMTTPQAWCVDCQDAEARA